MKNNDWCKHLSEGGNSFAQDVWSELGPPSGTTAKGVDTMLIHMKQASMTGADYFYNYHSRLVHGSSKKRFPLLCL